jgi:hypothetical protein
MLSGVNTLMWQAQDTLHKKPQLVPGAILATAGLMIVHRHMTHESDFNEPDFLKSYMGLIILQMLPLVALEMSIMSCADPVGLFCRFASPVTLTHAIFLGMRLALCQHDKISLTYSLLACAGGIITIIKAYRKSWVNILECQSVWGLVLVAFAGSVVTTSLDLFMHPDVQWSAIVWEAYARNLFLTCNAYIELLAFVPAVWMVYHEDKNSSRVQVDSTDTKRTATAFFLFLVAFYITEDLYNAYIAYDLSVMASITGLAHLALVLDFAVYVLAHIYNPEKLYGELRKWLPVDLSWDV